ncbi:PDZ domain-containing protein MAGIX [Sorex araneus]|uniref:PDZ domain-containing protein MAGIX n=1 Tax=Sorex araneus TaxID=42254 RepID=UPI002433F4B8|nr:PDZ domain-containing protein MAGIX [Sorex araneus]
MEWRAGGASDPRGARGGHGLRRRGHPSAPRSGRPSARQLLARLDARPLAARAANDVAALVRRAGTSLHLRPKDAFPVMDSAEIEVTDNRLPKTPFVQPRAQHHRPETVGPPTAPHLMKQGKVHSASSKLPQTSASTLPQASALRMSQVAASKLPQASDQFTVELFRSSVGFGFTLSGGGDASRSAELAIRGLLKGGPAQRCGQLQAGDLVLQINGVSTQGLTHAQAVERIRACGHRLCLVIRRPPETHAGKPEAVPRHQKAEGRSPDAGAPEALRSRSASASAFQQPGVPRTPQHGSSQERSPERAAHGPKVLLAERSRKEADDDRTPSSPGPWLVPSEERLSRTLGVSGAAQLALERAAGRRRH